MSNPPEETPAPDETPTPEEDERSGSYLSSAASKDPVVVRTARNVRRIGYTIAILGIAITALPVLIGVFRGVIVQDVRDPYSNRPIPTRDTPRDKTDCAAWGFELIEQKGARTLDPAQHAAWYDACGTSPVWISMPDRDLTGIRNILGTPPGR